MGTWRPLAITRDGNGLSVVDAEAGRVTAEMPLHPEPLGLALDPYQDRAFVTARADASVYRFHPREETLEGCYDLPASAASAVFDARAGVLLLSQHDGILRVAPDAARSRPVAVSRDGLRGVAASEGGGQALAVADRARARRACCPKH